MKNFFIIVLITILFTLVLTSCISKEKGEISNTKAVNILPTEEIKPTVTLSKTTSSISTDVISALVTYYNYTGGELPKDIVTPIKYTSNAKINSKMPEFTFIVSGINVQSYGLTADKSKYYIAGDFNKFNRIVIKCDATNYYQELDFPDTMTPKPSKDYYGFDLDDWNFDLYLDISLWKHEGGTSLNVPKFFWIWDNELKKYINNIELETLSESAYLKVDKENSQVVANQRLSPSGEYEGYYKLQDGKYVLVKTVEVTYAESLDKKTVIGHHVIKELINGKLKVTKDYYENI